CVMRVAGPGPHTITLPRDPVPEQGGSTFGRSPGNRLAAPRSPPGGLARTAPVDTVVASSPSPRESGEVPAFPAGPDDRGDIRPHMMPGRPTYPEIAVGVPAAAAASAPRNGFPPRRRHHLAVTAATPGRTRR